MNKKETIIEKIKKNKVGLILCGLFALVLLLLNIVKFSVVNNNVNDNSDIKTELNIIDRDIKGANPSYNDYINPNNTYNVIYCNNTLDTDTTFNDLYTFYTLYGSNFVPYLDAFIYPFYAYYEYADTNPYCICFVFEQLPHSFQISISTMNLNSLSVYRMWYYSISSDSSINEVVPLPSFMLPSMIMASITPFSSFEFSGVNIPVGALNQVLYSNFSSKQFETSLTPTLEDAPSSLVNTIPSNALTSLPNNLGTKVYDTGSDTININNNNVDVLRVEVYYESYINNESEFDIIDFEYGGDLYTLYAYKSVYYLTSVKVVISTLWGNIPIYYVTENLLDLTDIPFTLDYTYTDNINDFQLTSSINTLYSDYNYINLEYYYLMATNYLGITQYLIDTDDIYEALIPTNALTSQYGNKSFSLDVIPELDVNYVNMSNNIKNNIINSLIEDDVLNDIYDNAYDKGYDIGYRTAENEVTPIIAENGFKTMFNSILNAPFNIINGMINFELFGINLFSLFSFIFTLGLIAFVIKLLI